MHISRSPGCVSETNSLSIGGLYNFWLPHRDKRDGILQGYMLHHGQDFLLDVTVSQSPHHYKLATVQFCCFFIFQSNHYITKTALFPKQNPPNLYPEQLVVKVHLYASICSLCMKFMINSLGPCTASNNLTLLRRSSCFCTISANL